MRIGLLGATINNGNLGCVALTYSLLRLLHEIEEENKLDFEYCIFEPIPDQQKTQIACGLLGISDNKIASTESPLWDSTKQIVRHFVRNTSFIHKAKQCDVFIDLTEGDSFTDIYGDNRFLALTRTKYLIEKMGIPLILGPQTYGPYNKQTNLKFASKVLDKAKLIIARDNLSADLVKKLTNNNVDVTTDLAFQLPYSKPDISNSKRIGINVSGLLLSDKQEKTDTVFTLKSDYDKYIDSILEYLSAKDDVEVHLIPHVKEDMDGIEKIAQKFSECIVPEMFTNPIEAKSYIAGMDVFIGARMHATIASFTSGVPTIPTAYSRKFNGLFELVKYGHTVDLLTLKTDDAINLTIQKIESYSTLKQDVYECLKKNSEYYHKTKLLLKRAIMEK